MVARAGALVMDAGGLAHTLKPLARDGLIAIEVDPNDRPNRLIRLTRSGQAKLKQSDALWEAAQRGFESGFGGAKPMPCAKSCGGWSRTTSPKPLNRPYCRRPKSSEIETCKSR